MASAPVRVQLGTWGAWGGTQGRASTSTAGLGGVARRQEQLQAGGWLGGGRGGQGDGAPVGAPVPSQALDWLQYRAPLTALKATFPHSGPTGGSR